jgi:uncharacterized protein with PIN domain
MNEKEFMRCPKCGRELERGTMQASDVAFWNEGDVEEHLTSVLGLRGRSLESKAFRCKCCELVVFYYGKNAKRFTP